MHMQSHAWSALAFAAIAATMTAADDQPPPFKITTKQTNDRVEMKIEKDKVIFSVHSPFGISHAVIERTDEKWAHAVVLRLHLKGLENFQVTNGKVKLEASVSLRDGKPVVRLWKDGQEDTPLEAKSPFWIELRVLDKDGKPAQEIPLKEGYFEMQLPKEFFAGKPKGITVSWIDFYRN
jgi:hypothetical protein